MRVNWTENLALRGVETLFRLSPPYVAPRTLAWGLRAAGVQLGRASIFWGVPTLVGAGDICERLHIGSHCGFNIGCFFELEAPVIVGDRVRVGHEVMFLTKTFDSTCAEARGRPLGAEPIEIGSGTWVGSRCTILPGVKIGEGSVIAASTVVDRDIPDNVLYSGSRTISLARWRGA